MSPINRPNDLMMGADPSGASPSAAPLPQGRPPGAGPSTARPQARGGGMNPGGMEAVKAGIQQLLKMGLNEEQIVEAILKLAAESGMDIPEEEIRALIEQTAGQGPQATGAKPPLQGAPPQQGATPLPAGL